MRVAVIGGGVSGLVAAWLLQRRHEVTLFEANDYAGGHTHTVTVPAGQSELRIDTGFIVFNHDDYPLFTRMLKELDVASQPSRMSFSVHCEKTNLEYCAGPQRRRLFTQRRNLFRPKFYRMLKDIVRFYEHAPELLSDESASPSLGTYLHDEGYSDLFIHKHLYPMASALWSSPMDRVKDFPAHALVDFMQQHSMLELKLRPEWRAIQGGSSRYVEALTRTLENAPLLNTPVKQVQRMGEKVRVTTQKDEGEFDAAVMACHSGQALSLLDAPTAAEQQVLGDIHYSVNQVTVHTDTRLLPRKAAAWASWNYRIPAQDRKLPLVTYHMNQLQSLNATEQYCVTLNGKDMIEPERILGNYQYAHPQFDASAVAAQQQIPHINGSDRIWYCGAWTGYGFHEDGMRSAVGVAQGLGVDW